MSKNVLNIEITKINILYRAIKMWEPIFTRISQKSSLTSIYRKTKVAYASTKSYRLGKSFSFILIKSNKLHKK